MRCKSACRSGRAFSLLDLAIAYVRRAAGNGSPAMRVLPREFDYPRLLRQASIPAPLIADANATIGDGSGTTGPVVSPLRKLYSTPGSGRPAAFAGTIVSCEKLETAQKVAVEPGSSPGCTAGPPVSACCQ